MSLNISRNEPERAIEDLINHYKFNFNLEGDEIKHKADLYIRSYFDPSLRAEAAILLNNDLVQDVAISRNLNHVFLESEGLVAYRENNTALALRLFYGFYYPIYRPMFKEKRVRDYFIKKGIFAYWQTNGFPSFCRPVGDDDFMCE